jgi:hypothetical protein
MTGLFGQSGLEGASRGKRGIKSRDVIRRIAAYACESLETRILMSHFRGVNISWTADPMSDPFSIARAVTFHVQEAWRLDFEWTNLTNTNPAATPSVGDIIQRNDGAEGVFDFGDGGSDVAPFLRVTSVNTSEDWLTGQVVHQDLATGQYLEGEKHTYIGPDPTFFFNPETFDVQFSAASAISTLLLNQNDQVVTVHTSVTVGNGAKTASPVIDLPPIITIPDQPFAFQIPATDPNGNALSYAVSDPTGTDSQAFVQGLGVSPTGTFRYDLPPVPIDILNGGRVNGLIMVGVGAQARDSNFNALPYTSSAVFLLNVTTGGYGPPNVSVSPGTTLHFKPNVPLSFTTTATNTTFLQFPFPPMTTTTLTGLDGFFAPTGMTFGTVSNTGSQASVTANWTPTSSDLGHTYTVLMQATDNLYQETQIPVTLAPALAPTISVLDHSGLYNGNPFAATATVNGASSLEGIGLTLDYVNTDSSQDLGAMTPSHAGNYKVIASFAGSNSYLSGSASTTFSISKATPTVAVGDPGGTYNTVAFPATATVAGVVPGVDTTPAGSLEGVGIALDYVNNDTSQDLGAAAPKDAGHYSVAATYGGSIDYSGGTATAAFTITPAGTTLAVVSSTGGVSLFGQSVTLAATVAALAPGGGVPGGTVQFSSNGVNIGTAVALVGGKASLSTSGLSIGSDTIAATYLPDGGNYIASGNSLTQKVNSEVLLLDQTGQGALSLSGKADLSAAGSSIIVDSSSAKAVIVTGNGTVQADVTDVVGGVKVNGNGVVANIAPTSNVGDPLAGVAAPNLVGLPVQSSSRLQIGSGTVVLQPGVYVGGIDVEGSAVVTLVPGIYYFQGGGFSVGGQASITGQGVLLYNAPTGGTGGSQAGPISISGSVSVNLSAQTSGAYAGIAIFQDRASTSAITLGQSARVNLSGMIYAASATVSLSGSAVLNTFDYSLIVDDLNMSGTSQLVV